MYLFMFLMSLCNSNPKNQVESMNEFLDLEKKNGLYGAIGPNKEIDIHWWSQLPQYKT